MKVRGALIEELHHGTCERVACCVAAGVWHYQVTAATVCTSRLCKHGKNGERVVAVVNEAIEGICVCHVYNSVTGCACHTTAS